MRLITIDNKVVMKDYLSPLIIVIIIFSLTDCSQPPSSTELANFQSQDSLQKKNVEIVKSFYSYLDKQDTAALDKVVAKDFALYFGSSDQPVIFEQLKPLVKEVYSGFPDYKHEIEIIFGSENYVATKMKYTGTHLKTYMNIKPTGKAIMYKGIFIFKIEDGMITEMHGMEDNLADLIKGQPK